MDISELLAFSVKNNASDLHLSAGEPPMIRVDGEIRRINVPPMDHKTVHALIYDIMNDRQRKDYEEFLEVDFSFEIPDLARFRVNAFNHQRGAGAVFRTIPSTSLILNNWVARPFLRILPKLRVVWCWLRAQPARVSPQPWRPWLITKTIPTTVTFLPSKIRLSLCINPKNR